MSRVKLITRSFSTSSHLYRGKQIKKVSPKNFGDVYLDGTKQFITRQLNDPYVKLRRVEGYRCRSAYKLLEIQEKFDILQPGMTVIDLGAAPGSWSQVAQHLVAEQTGMVIAVDLLRIPPLENVHCLMGDFADTELQKKINTIVKDNTGSNGVEMVLCDAAPSTSGVGFLDHAIIVNLALSAAKFAIKNLKTNGTFLFKLFDGVETVNIMRQMRLYFHTVKIVKPPASRKDSSELYILCINFKGRE